MKIKPIAQPQRMGPTNVTFRGLFVTASIAGAMLLMAGCGGESAPSQPSPTSVESGGSTPQAAATSTSPPMVVSSPFTSSTSPPLRDLPTTPPIDPNKVSTPDATGVLTMTIEDIRGTAQLKVGDKLRFVLDEIYDWTIENSDASILSTDASFVAPVGTWAYKADNAGEVTLLGTGEPLCRQSNPPCGLASRVFEIRVVVK